MDDVRSCAIGAEGPDGCDSILRRFAKICFEYTEI